MRRLRFHFEDEPLEVEPEVGIDDGELTHLPTLGEDGQATALVVEVLKADALEGALPEPVLEQKP